MPSRISVHIDKERIKSRVLFATRKKVDQVFRKIKGGLTAGVREIIYAEIYNSPETESLLTPIFMSLQSQFGLTQELAKQAVDEIVNLATNSVALVINNSPKDAGLVSSIIINLSSLDTQSFLNLPSASYISERSGSKIEWLDWLLTKGSQIIVYDWHMIEGNGRSAAIMVPRGTFRVEGYQGIVEDNWITRAIDRAKTPISLLLQTKMRNEL